MRALLVGGVLVAVAPPGFAADGRLEINQARALAGGVTPGDAPGFPVVLRSAGSFVLTGDLTVPAGTTGIEVLAADVSIDLAGFAVQGPATCSALACAASAGGGIVSAASGTSVENGFVRGFGSICVSLGPSARIERVKVRACGTDGVTAGEGSLVLDGSVDSVGRDGITLKDPGVIAGNLVGSVSLGGAGWGSIGGGSGTRGNVCADDRCSRHARRRYYLTTGIFPATGVPTACAPGYHTASIHELTDPSALEYDVSRGDTNDDAGQGPISNNSGWVRTGGSASTTTNCNAWTSASASHDGTVAILQSSVADMNAAATVASPWSVFNGTVSCDGSTNVWCIED